MEIDKNTTKNHRNKLGPIHNTIKKVWKVLKMGVTVRPQNWILKRKTIKIVIIRKSPIKTQLYKTIYLTNY